MKGLFYIPFVLLAVLVLAVAGLIVKPIPAEAQTPVGKVHKFNTPAGPASVTIYDTLCSHAKAKAHIDKLLAQARLAGVPDPAKPPMNATWDWAGAISPGCYIVHPLTGRVWIVDEDNGWLRPVPTLDEFETPPGA